MTAPQALVAATLDHLTRFSPFDQMERAHLAWMIERSKLGYYARGEVVASPDAGEARTFFIIKQGVIHGEQDVVRAQEDATWLELHEGECFPLGALLSRRNVNSTYKAGEDTFCYELAADDFRELLRMSPAFHDFCTRRIANLLEQSKQVIQAQYVKSTSEQQSMTSPLSAVIRREPVTCAPDAPMRQVLETMNELGIGSMVAVDADKRPLGIFTLHDVLKRVTLPGLDLATPFSAVMSPEPVTLPPHALAYEAALVMARHGFRHVLVEETGRLKGLVSEKDLFSLQRVGLRQLSGMIRKAENLDSLIHAAADIRQLAHNMLAQGVTAEQLTQIISTLNDLLTQRIIELELEADPAAREVEFCWLALGSEGRLEQTLNTDQDNGILFAVPDGRDAAAVREVMLPFAKRINLALAECGFPLCNGEVMASNPKWCLSLAEWKDTFDKWIFHGDPMALLYSTIFFDFRPLFGAEHLAEELRDWLAAESPKNTRFLHQMAVNALRNRPPLGIVRDFVTGDGHTIDLKLNGITPFVDATRIYCLAYGLKATNTLQRIREMAGPLNLSEQDAEAYGDAFLFIQLLRLRLHHEQCQLGQPLTNKVDPDHLNALDSRILREAFRQARKLQTKLGLDYQV
ncbi:MAG TPA: DUF294 nucleotidyltransferase-like domain-containing protein [Thiobacillaceae bacterium]|nr:DUF294 nucleotidyltransferase-like domain-containing protein [Thiobacillaceae bacterium]